MIGRGVLNLVFGAFSTTSSTQLKQLILAVLVSYRIILHPVPSQPYSPTSTAEYRPLPGRANRKMLEVPNF
jgi:hypothetical protein